MDRVRCWEQWGVVGLGDFGLRDFGQGERLSMEVRIARRDPKNQPHAAWEQSIPEKSHRLADRCAPDNPCRTGDMNGGLSRSLAMTRFGLAVI